MHGKFSLDGRETRGEVLFNDLEEIYAEADPARGHPILPKIRGLHKEIIAG